jgi:hypothetical protein
MGMTDTVLSLPMMKTTMMEPTHCRTAMAKEGSKTKNAEWSKSGTTYVCTHVGTFVSNIISIYVNTNVNTYVGAYVSMYVRMYASLEILLLFFVAAKLFIQLDGVIMNSKLFHQL